MGIGDALQRCEIKLQPFILALFTPLKGVTDSHVLPIGVRWNPGTKRYQSLDRTYEHFLLESPSLDTARSSLR